MKTKLNELKTIIDLDLDFSQDEIFLILKALRNLPPDVQAFFMKNSLYITGSHKDDDTFAYCLQTEEFKRKKSVIYLNESLWKENEKEIIRTLFHEFAHCYKSHSGSASPEVVNSQEKEADKLADKWFRRLK